jgi:RNA polymerase sigma-70 factor (ECF subfamily)
MRRPSAPRAEIAPAHAGPTQAGDDLLIDRMTVGSSELFEDFYLREFPRLRILATALGGSAHAEDIAQETLLVAYRRWETIGAMSSPAGYVRGICVHKAVTVARRRAAERRLLGRLAVRRTAAGQTLEDELSDDTRLFWAQVRALPRRQTQVAALHYALDMSVSEIAKVLNCAEGTVKAHLFRARGALAAALAANEEEHL